MKKKYYSPTLEEQEITTSCGIMIMSGTEGPGGNTGGADGPLIPMS